MSNAGAKYRDEQRVDHMVTAIESVVAAAAGMTRDRLMFDDEKTKSILFDLIVLGEAANNISREYAEEHPEIPWADIAGFRHKLVHDYCGIDYGIVWEGIANQLPPLLPKMKELAASLPPVEQLPENIGEFLKSDAKEQLSGSEVERQNLRSDK